MYKIENTRLYFLVFMKAIQWKYILLEVLSLLLFFRCTIAMVQIVPDLAMEYLLSDTLQQEW